MAVRQNLEIWENVTEALVGLRKLDHRGVETDVLVHAGRKVHMTPEEREINEGLCVDDKFNPFRNGLLRAVRLTDDPEAGEVKSGAALTEEEINEFFRKPPTVFNKAVAVVDSDILLRRMIEQGEAGEVTMKQLDTLRKRLEQVSPALTHIPVETRVQ